MVGGIKIPWILLFVAVSFGSIDELEDDVPIVSIVWSIWMINAKPRSVYFNLDDPKQIYRT